MKRSFIVLSMPVIKMHGYITFVPGGFQMSHYSLINSDEGCPHNKVLLPFVVTFMAVKMYVLMQPSKPAD